MRFLLFNDKILTTPKCGTRHLRQRWSFIAYRCNEIINFSNIEYLIIRKPIEHLKSALHTEFYNHESLYNYDIIDFSNIFNVSYKSTTPNLLASFIKLMENGTIDLCNVKNFEFNATSHIFYIISGKASIHIDDEEVLVYSGDILITPCFNSVKIKNLGEEKLKIYYVNDSPLVNYLGSKAKKKIFKTAIYSNEFLFQKLNELSNKES
jgi:mannose-6-phosphate isomerase-like protein (cupin superfamily)